MATISIAFKIITEIEIIITILTGLEINPGIFQEGRLEGGGEGLGAEGRPLKTEGSRLGEGDNLLGTGRSPREGGSVGLMCV